MKASFQHKTVNDPFGDPVLYVKLFKEKRALMFDCGDISPLSSGTMLKVTDLFITHTHIDHFIGFDTLLRTLLSRKNAPLRIFGPANITDCVEGKLMGY
ncbi:ribonuclease Z, partial [bacterium]|nr:ribonuclease Z [bacterium]